MNVTVMQHKFEVVGMDCVRVSINQFCLHEFIIHLHKLHNVLYIHTDDEITKLPYIFKDDDKQCLNLMQKAQENFHLKQTLVTNVCSCELEQQGWNWNVTNSLFNCQIDIENSKSLNRQRHGTKAIKSVMDTWPQ